MKMKSIFCLMAGLVLSFNTLSQTRKIIDSETNRPVPYVNVYSVNTLRGTITNELGEFDWNGSPTDSVMISHVSYQSQKVLMNQIGDLIKLKPRTALLTEVVVSDFARSTLKKAYQKGLSKVEAKNFGKAFYRQVTRNDDVPTVIQEIFYTIESNNGGVTRNSMEEARYAIKKKKDTTSIIVNMTNTSFLVLGIGGFSEKPAKERTSLGPFMPDSDEFYDFSVVEEFTVGADKLVKIHFEPTDGVTKPASYGEVVINESTLDIRHLTLFHKNSLGVDTLRNAKKKWPTSNNLYQFNFDFLENGQLNYIKCNGSFDFGDENKKHKVEVEAFLFVYERLNKSKNKLHEAEMKTNDLAVIAKKKYNAKFWKDNPIVKRTPIQEDITSQFEKDGAFGTMFSKK